MCCGASVGTCRPSDRALLRGLRRGLVCSGAELLCVAWQLVVRADTTVEALCVDASGMPPELVVTTYARVLRQVRVLPAAAAYSESVRWRI